MQQLDKEITENRKNVWRNRRDRNVSSVHLPAMKTSGARWVLSLSICWSAGCAQDDGEALSLADSSGPGSSESSSSGILNSEAGSSGGATGGEAANEASLSGVGGSFVGSGGTFSGGGGQVVGSGGEAPTVDCSPIADNPQWDLCGAGTSFCAAVFNDSAGCSAVCAAVGLECAEVWENPADGSCAADTSRVQLSCDPESGHQSDYCLCSGAPGSGGASGAGGAQGAGGQPGSGGSGSGGDSGSGGTSSGSELSIFDPVPGYASVSGGTTGGGTNLAGAITVSSMSALQNAADGSNAAIILVQPGTYDGELDVGSNKTIVGVAPGVRISGNLNISGSDSNNVIIRNIAIQGKPCGSYDECRDGDDAVYIGNGAHHVWLDHLDISDGQDGNCDVTRSGDFVTISWTRFHYTYDKEHRFSNLIAGGDGETESAGKLRITYMLSHWGERVDSRQPRGRFGNVHMLNNYHNTGGGQIHGVGYDMALIAENSVYNENRSIWTDMGDPRGWKGISNIGTGSGLNDSRGTVFTIPYAYSAYPANEVVDLVTSSQCGAGNTCSFEL